jgi:hypothetical protein
LRLEESRLKRTALTGFAGLGGWLIKGKAKMETNDQITMEMNREQKGLMENVSMESFTRKTLFETIYDLVERLSIKQ